MTWYLGCGYGCPLVFGAWRDRLIRDFAIAFLILDNSHQYFSLSRYDLIVGRFILARLCGGFFMMVRWFGCGYGWPLIWVHGAINLFMTFLPLSFPIIRGNSHPSFHSSRYDLDWRWVYSCVLVLSLDYDDGLA